MFEDPARDVLTPSQLNTLARDLLESAFPVSYTHLDVYKRQHDGRTRHLQPHDGGG